MLSNWVAQKDYHLFLAWNCYPISQESSTDGETYSNQLAKRSVCGWNSVWYIYALVAQGIEQGISNPLVVGSNPTEGVL